jgi:multidrug efflux system outer membrane protein
MNYHRLGFLSLSLLLSGCLTIPTYTTPDVDVPCEWHSEMPMTMQAGPCDGLNWWERLDDPVLNELITYAFDQNLDLRIASMRVLQARSEAKAKKGDLYPHIDATANLGACLL